jgi:serine/threonine protein kinase
MADASFDLTPFGVPHMLRPGFDFKSIKQTDLNYGMCLKGVAGNALSFIFGESEDTATEYRIVEKLGEGTYGIGYKVVDPDGKFYVIKYIKKTLSNSVRFVYFLKECVIQLLVVEASKDKLNGPYAPQIYEICYDNETGEGFIRSELMRDTLANFIDAHSQRRNDILVPNILIDLSTMLKDLETTLLFTHRDMKGDNLMYIKRDDKRLFRFIDFGFACITWNGMKIDGDSYTEDKSSCFKKDRDLSQLLFYLVRYHKSVLSDELLYWLEQSIIANVGPEHKCKMYKLCPAFGLSKWKNSYNFLNRANVSVPGGTPNYIQYSMIRFLEGKKFKSPRHTLRHVRNRHRKTYKIVRNTR